MRVGEVRDVEALEQLVDAPAPRVGDVRAHGEVWEERVLLEDEPDAPLLRTPVDPQRRVEPDLVAERNPARARTHESGDDAQRRRLARAGRPDERDRPLDLEAQLEVESAKREGEVRREGCHCRTSLIVMRSAALTSTSRALTASATVKFTSNSA